MDSREFFRRWFGFSGRPSRPHFNEDELAEEDNPDRNDGFSLFFGDSSQGLEGMFEHFHGDMWRQMDCLHRQMEEMMRGFGAIDFHSSMDVPPSQPSVPGKIAGDKVFSWTYTPTPFFRHAEKKSPRDFMLKDGVDDELARRPALPASPHAGHESKFGSVLPATPFNIPGSGNTGDTDLDGKFSEDKLLEMIKQPNQKMPSPHVLPSQDKPYVFSAKKSVSVSTVKGPDNKVEHKRTVRDSSGHEESTITRTIGDKSYTITTVTGKDGGQQRHEAFKNMDESEVSKFEDEWKQKKQVQPGSPIWPLLDMDDKSLFTRLFDWKDQ
ncbi:hypothetical protein BsWGS_00929 [Bradybaena similaris]